jgi:hypothetical protein
MLALGLVAAVAVGAGFAREGKPQCCSKPLASWGIFTPAQWSSLKSTIARRGFDAASIRVVSSTAIANSRPFALLAATSRTGATCVIPVEGSTLGATTCRLSKPLLLFTTPDTWTDPTAPGVPVHTVQATAVLGLVRPDVTGVVARDNLGHTTGVALVPAGRMGAFAAGFGDVTSLSAYGAHGRVLARLTLRTS